MASAGAIWGPPTLRLLRVAVSRAANAVRTRLADATRPLQNQAQHASKRQPIHPLARLKHQKRGARLFYSEATNNINNALRRFITSKTGAGSRFDRSRLPVSNTSRRVAQLSGRTPFASTLRPNLTGGALPRTAGGYSLGGGGAGAARYFSHTPAAPAQVVQNVSQAMRAFFLSGQKIRYEGLGPCGQPRYRAVSNVEDVTMRKQAGLPRSAPGAFIDFQLSPKFTALGSLAAAIARASDPCELGAEVAVLPMTLNTEGFLNVLSADFGRALKDLTAVYADLERLSVLGDLPVVLEKSSSSLRVRFPGADASTVELLCNDIGIQRGIIGQDAGFDAAVGVPMALRFPFAPDSEKTVTSPGGSERSLGSHEYDHVSSLQDDSFVREAFENEMEANPWLSDPENDGTVSPTNSSGHSLGEFEGLEGIYRFLEECDRWKGRLG